MKVLYLPLKKKWFDQIKSGSKLLEYRVRNDYWKKRLEGKSFDKIILTLGYPKRDDEERRIERPWRGYEIQTITHPEWLNFPTECFCIIVNWEAV